MAKIYKQPFAHSGDAIAIPSASQPDGKMSSADGWTPDYQLLKTDPNYKPVGRQEMNGVFKEVTEALGQVQVQGAASWSGDGAPYPVNAQVYHDGKQWIALRANSVEPAEGEDWKVLASNPWVSRAIGEEIWLDDSNPAVQVPPTGNSSFRYIKLTAGENGSGGYNEGVLINEAVSGSSPQIEATAVINLPNSPFHGQVVRLLNTERRFVRSGLAGVMQEGMVGRHTHNYIEAGGAYLGITPQGGVINRSFVTSEGATVESLIRTSLTGGGIGEETRPRNIGRTVYMRIL